MSEWVSQITEQDRRWMKRLGMRGNRLNLQIQYAPAYKSYMGGTEPISVKENPECHAFYAQKARDIRYGYKKV